jgi:hypothetical protein
MKTLLIILSVIGLFSLNSCKQEKNAQALLENPETRNEIFTTIEDNQDYMSEFMVNMQKSDHAMQMMQGEGMQMMMKDSMMMKNMMGNKPMMNTMMDRMMKNPETMGSMMQMMHEKGMMTEDCMQSCMQMMDGIEVEVKNGSDSKMMGDH